MELIAESEKRTRPPYVAVIDTQLIGSIDEARMNFEAQSIQKPKAMILLVDATGGSKDILNPFIKEAVDEGTPVFLLSKNYGRNTGIQKVAYGTQSDAVEAGATPLRDINVNSTLEVVNVIQAAVDQGLTGSELKVAIVEQFGSPVVKPTK
ncbi:hypothetical protein A3J19_02000 [Candidatus Daviesbacteria bacterium RIFCSPLOWO2_02_FULL_41_8]|uniref:Uncharacterized protein n=3 Tax=Candidatus Daviesiibacteriota TaxID=1752718 RepID=A0A1F5NIF3_9BACT|nr:MAG: hypothetical protein A2871_03245 [Candidatus Daviesbacteria bacterium RIFCSPHIGHO2_01_FULL_41_23]OGE32424.1 MAG: hypothetical protein A3D83_02090 [Candidatus Daviesbacteria bacterium RIFCSPHIGHO2_02_FULL_41_10]OGE61943.1 MAG: hypothetical protein A2967_03060 [Candidatus Daviesbacteria bacterium RIFCSPLOWO2_01_FULL_41_32]OGE77398.1 MAG: hypothetical protein A3J19_02000 [Candidatus Daviesbacteria bacterium RIFCSPLOWO2_02_FULL_41_8]